MTSRAGLRFAGHGQIQPGGSLVSATLERLRPVRRPAARARDSRARAQSEPGRVLGQRVAVALAVGGAHEGADDLEVPLGDVVRLAPEIGETDVDVELQQVDA